VKTSAVPSLYRSFARLLRSPELRPTLATVGGEFRVPLAETVVAGGCVDEADALDKRMEVGRRELRLLEKGMGVGKNAGVTREEMERAWREGVEEGEEEEDEPVVGEGWPWER
jgi:hypothetical protein